MMIVVVIVVIVNVVVVVVIIIIIIIIAAVIGKGSGAKRCRHCFIKKFAPTWAPIYYMVCFKVFFIIS